METILNYLVERTLIILFLCGAVYIITALITLRFPPKKINYLYGYRTNASMKNQEVWDFAQRYSSIKMLQAGFVMFGLSFINLIFDCSESAQLWFGIPVLIIATIVILFSTERAIKKNFPNE